MSAAQVVGVEEPQSGVFARRFAARQPEAHFEANLEAHALPKRTREEVLACRPRGQFKVRPDGASVLELDQAYLDSPLNSDVLGVQAHGAGTDALLVVVGLGAGNFVRGLREVCEASIVVYEPDPGILRSFLESGPSDLSDVSVVTNLRDFIGAWAHYASREVEAVVAVTPGYREAYPDAVGELTKTAENLVARIWISRNTTHQRARVWIEDIIRNVRLLPEAMPALSLAERLRGVPAFVVGAGPSLDKNIDQMAEAVRKGVVFATNSGALALAERGIEPQVVVYLESIDSSARLRELPFIDRCVRAFSLVSAPQALESGKGPLMPFHEGLPQYGRPLSELLKCAPIGVCSSVSTAAFSLAREFGCSPIVLVGQDMAYTEGKAYASGTGYESSHAEHAEGEQAVSLKWNKKILDLHGTSQGQRMTHDPVRRVPAWGGEGTVLSGMSFTGMHSWFEDTASLACEADPELRLVNATEGGVEIRGFEPLTLRAVLDGLSERPLSAAQLWQQARDSREPVSVFAVRVWLEKNARIAADTRRRARRLRRLALLASRVTAQHAQPERIRELYARLESAEAELSRLINRCPLIDAWAHCDVLEVVRSLPEQPDSYREGATRAVDASARIGDAVERAAMEIHQELMSSLERMPDDAQG